MYRLFQLGIPKDLAIPDIIGPFRRIGFNFYFFEPNIKLTWFGAFEACRRMEADLLGFDRHEDLEFLYQHISTDEKLNGSNYWTSGTDLQYAHKHVWLSNGKNVTSKFWAKLEPNNRDNNEHCDELELRGRDGKMGLNDKPCSTEIGYICYKASRPKTASFIIF